MWVVRLFLGTLIGPFAARSEAEQFAAERGGEVVSLLRPW